MGWKRQRFKASLKDREASYAMIARDTTRASFFRTHRWLLLVMLAVLILSLSNVIIKFLRDLSAADLSLARYTGMFIFNLPFLIHSRSRQAFERKNLPTLLARGVFGSTSFYFSYLSLKLMPIAESAVIVSTTPVWVSLLSWLFLKERVDIFNGISTALCVAGLVLMSKVFQLTSEDQARHWDSNYWYGCVASMLSAVLAALTFVFIRSLKHIHESVTIAYQSSIGMVGIMFLEAATWNGSLPGCGLDGVLVVVMTFLSFLGQKMVTIALQHEKASFVSNVRFSTRVVVLVLFQILFFNELPDAYSGVAVVCVSASLLVLGFRNVWRPKGL